MLSRTSKFIDVLDRMHDEKPVQQSLADVASTLGMTSVFGGIVPPSRSQRSIRDVWSYVMIQHLPTAWRNRYNRGDYLGRDPILQRLGYDRTPFTWGDAYTTCDSRENVKLIGGEAGCFGLRDGYVIPLATLDGKLLAVSFGGPQMALSPDQRSALAFASSYAMGRLLSLRGRCKTRGDRITSREFDALLWAGEGKTDWEISVIMGISRSTVTKHIASARRKLHALNKAHAVAIALRMKMLQ